MMPRITVADCAVIALALALLPYLYLTYWGAATQGAQARILRGGEQIALVSLHEHKRLSIEGELGTSELEIKDGKIRFINSPCRNQQCVHSGWVSLGGDFIACLPNRISVQVVGREPRFDSINF
ncbi:MAG: NusG domain II-containing protein [Gammaproteobacteria bacterium]